MLENYGFQRRYRDGELIFRQGSRGDEMYVIRSGKVTVFATDGGVDTTFAVLAPKDFFGEMSLLTGEPRSASARATGDVEVSVIDHATFDKLVSEPLVREMLVRMSQRLSEVDKELQKFGTQDSVRREHLSHLIEQRHWFA